MLKHWIGKIRQYWPSTVPSETIAEPIEDLGVLNPVLRCGKLYANFDFSEFTKYQQRHGQGIALTVFHPTIEDLLNDLQAHLTDLMAPGFINHSRVNYQPMYRAFNRFFVSKEGYYLSSIYAYLVQLQILIGKIDNYLAEHDQADCYSYNLRMLSGLAEMLCKLHIDLTAVQLRIQFDS